MARSHDVQVVFRAAAPIAPGFEDQVTVEIHLVGARGVDEPAAWARFRVCVAARGASGVSDVVVQVSGDREPGHVTFLPPDSPTAV